MEHAAHDRSRCRSPIAQFGLDRRSPLELIVRHDRWFLTGALLLVTVLAWAWLFAGAGMGVDGIKMTRMSMDDSAFMAMPAMAPARWSATYALLMFSMWWIMMVAMMLPSAAPVILLAAALNRKANPDTLPFGSSGAFTSGYLLGWGVFSVLAVAMQWSLIRIGVLSDMLLIKSPLMAGVLLIVAGVWQFTPYKQACLRHCRSPIQFLTSARRPGAAGAVVMGLNHSLYCLGCCWFLMLLLFVGGVMNLLWIAGLALYVWFEKVLPGGRRVSHAAGVALILGGIVVLI